MCSTTISRRAWRYRLRLGRRMNRGTRHVGEQPGLLFGSCSPISRSLLTKKPPRIHSSGVGGPLGASSGFPPSDMSLRWAIRETAPFASSGSCCFSIIGTGSAMCRLGAFHGVGPPCPSPGGFTGATCVVAEVARSPYRRRRGREVALVLVPHRERPRFRWCRSVAARSGLHTRSAPVLCHRV